MVYYDSEWYFLGFDMNREESKFRIKNPGVWSLVFFILLMAEALLLRYLSVPLNYNLLIMQLPFTVCFFEFLKSDRFSHIKVSRKLREYNTQFYLTHAMFLELIPLVLGFIQQQDLWQMGWFRFLTVMICTYLLSNLLIYIADKRKEARSR